MKMDEQNNTMKKKTFCNCYCCVSTCSSKKDRNKDLHFHSFPKEGASSLYITNDSGSLERMDRRKAWITKLRIQKPVTHNMRVCSLHFQDSDYLAIQAIGLQNMKAPRLKFNAVPSINLPSKQNMRKKRFVTKRNEEESEIFDLTENEQSVVHALMDLKTKNNEKWLEAPKGTRKPKPRNYKCCVFNCSSSKDESEGLCFHKFPKEGESTVSVTNSSGILEEMDRRKAWIEKLLIGEPFANTKWVCSLHFQESDYLNKDTEMQKMKPRRLKQTAVPSQNLPEEQYMHLSKLGLEPNNVRVEPEPNNIRMEPEPSNVRMEPEPSNVILQTKPTELWPEMSELTVSEQAVANALLDMSEKNEAETSQSTKLQPINNCNCCVANCHSKKSNNRALHFHKFPEEGASFVYAVNDSGIVEKVDRRKVWIQRLMRTKPVTRHLLVCSLHFQESDYLSRGPALHSLTAPKLKNTAIPSQNLPTLEDIRKKLAKRCVPRLEYQDPNFEDKLLKWFEKSSSGSRAKTVKKLYLKI
ncbi:uncharacterized protein LOC123676332 [Harmonia axyridis]|uniref:uncharacterized protein LOC123676332 n=1 Tax=Harmonia axyridis TaxID=115357 RepID=UPI001E2768A1|nr:uncharacterized protein LOC123676332 [Harmonia axyridis]XP_045468139.1 uncharacterized protein LOC123676332 [Harmonia axyridis]